MLRRVSSLFFAVLLVARTSAAPSPSPSPTATATSTPSPSPTPSPSEEMIINSMSAGDLQQAIQLLKSNYINPDALSETELDRAMLLGVLDRVSPGVMVLAGRATQPNESTNPCYGELIDGHIGYLRFGALTEANLQALDTHLQNMRAKKADAAVIDLRASPDTNDFAIAAEFAKRFVAKSKPLFSLRRAGVKQERTFTNDRDPAYDGLMLVLADSDTSGPAEAIAATLHLYAKALVIGQPTAGQAVEFSDLPLNGGRILRVAVAEAVMPDGQSLFPKGVKPDLPVEMSLADKRLIFQQSATAGMGPFINETERPHLNEAALLSGRNPELEAAETGHKKPNGDKPALRDPVLQRAVDVITSLAVYQAR